MACSIRSTDDEIAPRASAAVPASRSASTARSQILDYDEERLDLALPEQQALQGVQGSVTALRGLERLPLRILHWDVQECEERRECGLQGRIERE